MTPAPVDFLEALALKSAAAEIQIGGRRLSVARAPLALHYRLQSIIAEQADGADLGEVAADYVAAAAGLTVEEIDAGSPVELMAAFTVLVTLNRFRGTLALLWPARRPPPAGAEDYPHRTLASIVATLAHAYGWPADHILGLGPEEAMCYAQEARVLAHAEQEAQWQLAGGAVDRTGKRITFPPIEWGASPERPRVKRPAIPESLLPAGVVVSSRDLGERGAQ